MLQHLLDDDVRTSWDISVKEGFNKNGLADLKFVGRHGAPPSCLQQIGPHVARNRAAWSAFREMRIERW